MNREIKFRGWDKYRHMYHETPVAMSNDGMLRFNPDSGKWFDTGFISEQFTGLKDKNGVEVYEGDILKVSNTYGEFYVPVGFHNGYFASDNHKAKQIKNPDGWECTHDKVHSYGFMMSRYSQLMDGYSNVSGYDKDKEGSDKTFYDIEVAGNIHLSPELLG